MAKVEIKGTIIPNDDQWIYDWLEWDATSPRKVQQQIDAAMGADLEVEINSGGGSVFDGSEIYTAIKSHPANKTVRIVGLAASAASVIAMAGDKILMAPTAQMMIHNASIRAAGDYRDMDHMSEVLKNVNQTIANAYRIKTGKSDKELLKMMDNETWMTPQQALEHGFIDEIMFDQAPMLVASADISGMLPVELINKIREKLKPADIMQPAIFMREKAAAQATFELLKLKGVEEA